MTKTETRSAFFAELLYRLRTAPLRNWHWLRDKLSDGREDENFGIVSSGKRSTKALGLPSPDAFHYQPFSFADLREVFEVLSFGSEDTLVDFGSGMGRALCFAAAVSPLHSIIGVEVSPELCDIARQNLARIRQRMRCLLVEVVNEDAAKFQVPPHANVFLFFNPFGASVLERVFRNIEESLRARPRPVRVLFYGTASSVQFAVFVERYRWLRPESKRILRTGATLLTYRSPTAF